LDGIQVELQATDPSEMSLDIVKGRAIWMPPLISPLSPSQLLIPNCLFQGFEGHPVTVF
jgi:hypothetical protein